MLDSFAFGASRLRPVTARIGALRRPARVALTGADYRGLRPDFCVAEGDPVDAGQALFTDRHMPELAFVAPAAGLVESITLGAGRSLSAIVIRLTDMPEPPLPTQPPTVADGESARRVLLRSGIWPAFRSRPYGRIPNTDATPKAIFVNAMADRDGAPDPQAIVPQIQPFFDRGLEILAMLTDGRVFNCQGDGPDLASLRHDRIRTRRFASTARTSLSTHHIRRLDPPAIGQSVWTVGWQEVAAVGELVETGRYPGTRVIALNGPRGTTPELFPTLLGADLHDLVNPEYRRAASAAADTFRLFSGAAIGGHESRWLGRLDTQAALVPVPSPSALARLASLLGGGDARRVAPILPTAGLDTALPTEAPALPLMRALAVGDFETAERLGCRDLVEEDMAGLTHLCTSGSDYGRLLRRALDEIEAVS